MQLRLGPGLPGLSRSRFCNALLFQINSLPSGNRIMPGIFRGQMREGPMSTAGLAFLFAGGFSCLLFAVIAMLYFAERLRSDFLAGLDKLSKHHRFRGQQ